MEDKPLSQESLESSIRQLDPNKRFELVKNHSHLHSIDKSVPLQIDTLTFDDLKIKVNDTEYKFGVFKKYHQKEETPPFVRYENDRGGSDCNVDEYGFNDYSLDFLVEKGDVVISSLEYWKEAWEEQFEHNWIERSNERKEWLMRKVKDLHRQLTIQKLALLQNPSKIKNLQAKLYKYQSYLLPFYYRESGVRPFDAYTQLTITSPSGIYIERFEYNGNVHSSPKALSTQFFGNRDHPIEVRRFEANEPVIRLPPGVKFRINGLKIRYPISDVIRNLQKIIDQSSYPLEYLKINSKNVHPEDLGHEVVRQANEVVVTGVLDNEKWTPELEKMKNQIVEVRDGFKEDPYEDLCGIISSWKKGGRVGSKLTVRLREGQDANEILRKLAEDLHKDSANDKSHFLLPLDFTTDLKISQRSITAGKNNGFWTIRLETVPKSLYVESVALCARLMEKFLKAWSICNWNF